MDEPVDDGSCDDVVIEDLAPFRKRLVRSDDHRTPFITTGDQLEEDVRIFLLNREVTDLVDDQKLVFRIMLHDLLMPVLSVGFLDFGDQVIEMDEIGADALAARFDADGGS